MSRPQLAPGVEIVTAPGRPPAVRTPGGEFVRLNAPREAVAGLLDLLGGGPADRPAEPQAARLLDAFAEAGYLDAPPPWPPERADILVLGDDRLTAPLTGFLSAAGARPRPGTPKDVAALADARTSDAAAVVWCLDRPVPPGLWEDADRLPARGIAWARCHREGLQVWIEPIAASPGDVLSAHVAARRLAATPAHRELAAYWAGAAGASGGTVVSGPHPVTGPAAAATAAALLAADLADWAVGACDGRTKAPLPARRRLRRLDLRDLTVTDHCVLPVPRVAPITEHRA
ncbi:hypothetical protein [Actinomadura keratinilytica]|uniref:Uncharacterized protein n=1 Tax=Actinomadura keratinilytica TaxID=547461 RepID=A0ABP7YFR3_9ACTN